MIQLNSPNKHWPFSEFDEQLLNRYDKTIIKCDTWDFTGYVFPAMDDERKLAGQEFPAADFRGVEFVATADFRAAEFSGQTNFSSAKFKGEVDFSSARFKGEVDFSSAEFTGRADFQDSVFLNCVKFIDAEFQSRALFLGTSFQMLVDFWGARFRQGGNFLGAKFASMAWFKETEFFGETKFKNSVFSAKAVFIGATFHDEADFENASFEDGVEFSSSQFVNKLGLREAKFNSAVRFEKAKFNETDFSQAHFGGDTDFQRAEFMARADFSSARFSGPADFSEASINALADFSGAQLTSRMLFAGTRFEENARILLWSLNCTWGKSDLAAAQGPSRGKLDEQAGQVEFRDIPEGINRVSFLHTDILTDRVFFWFSNVRWDPKPEKFIFDARFALSRDVNNWPEDTSLPQDRIDSLAELYHVRRKAPEGETPPDRSSRERKELQGMSSLVRLDVERTAREIRHYYETYGSYPDAGDYYIAEMDYRRHSTAWWPSGEYPRIGKCCWKLQSLGRRLLLQFYSWLSRYGESVGRPLGLLLGLLIICVPLYLLTGFNFNDKPVELVTRYDRTRLGPTLVDILRALVYSFTNIVPGWFRTQTLAPASQLTTAISVIETLFGTVIGTLLILAIRRRFRR